MLYMKEYIRVIRKELIYFNLFSTLLKINTVLHIEECIQGQKNT